MPYPLRTPRLVIEPLTEADLPEFVAYRQDPDVARYQGWTPDYSLEDAMRLVDGPRPSGLPAEGDWLQLAVRPASAGPLHGDVAVHRLTDPSGIFEVDVTLAPASQGHGVAAEAVATVPEFLFSEGDAHRVVAFCDARNEPVSRLLRRVGMRQESAARRRLFKGGVNHPRRVCHPRHRTRSPYAVTPDVPRPASTDEGETVLSADRFGADLPMFWARVPANIEA